MSIMGNIDWEKLNKLKEPVDFVLDCDIEKLRRMDDIKRFDRLNTIESNRNTFEEEFLHKFGSDELGRKIAGDFDLARLFLATAAHLNQEENPIIELFNEREFRIVDGFDRFNVFDILSTEEIVEKIARKEDIYDLVIEVYKGQYFDLDTLLDDAGIQRDLRLALKYKYKKRLDKIKKGVVAYVEKYGPVMVVNQIESKIWERIKESEMQRKEISESLKKRMEELGTRLGPLEEIDEKGEHLKSRLRDLERELFAGGKLDTGSIDTEKDSLFEHYSRFEKELTDHAAAIEERRRELDAREAELLKAREEYDQRLEEEKQRLVESELKEIEALKIELLSKEQDMQDEKRSIVLKREEITDRLREITKVQEGKSIRFVTKEDAKLAELNFIARFDTKMHGFPLKIDSPIENKTYEIKSWKGDSHVRLSEGGEEENTPMPSNVHSLYTIEEKKHRFFGEKVKKVVIEAVSFNHLEGLAGYGFDVRRVSLAEFLSLITRFIDRAELGEYLHVIGIASPTGFDERVINEVRSTEFARNYVSRYVSVCLVDSVTGEVYYNPADERIAKFVDFFKPVFDSEKEAKGVKNVRKYILEEFKTKDYVVFDDVLKETGEERRIVLKVFYDLEEEGIGRVRYIKDVGLVLEAKR